MSNRLLAFLAMGWALSAGPATAVEEPAFTTVLAAGAFQIRDYPASVVAEVSVRGSQKAASYQGFRLLAGYIFGGNRRGQNIAMTAPVTQARAGATIAMTAPVARTREAGVWIVRFTMPRARSLATLPPPNDPRVRLTALPPTRYAVLRFSGLAAEGAVAARTAELQTFATARRLRAAGPAILAQYDPPWTPGFMRRNEVLLPVEP